MRTKMKKNKNKNEIRWDEILLINEGENVKVTMSFTIIRI